ncbi:MAG: urea amidolyase associated protein UAAP2 [Verrucomicrobiota bacterium]
MSALNYCESPLSPDKATVDQTIGAGDGWMHLIKAGQTFRILDVEGNQAADTLFYDAADFSNRYSAQDTVQRQGALYLTTGTRLMSSEGDTLLTITADTCGRHDTIGGACATESNQVRYALEKRWMHACRDTFMLQLIKWGRGASKADITNNINFFMNVPVTPDGGLSFADGVGAVGSYVEMRAERDVVALVSSCPQLNNPCNAWNPTPLRFLIWD